ncbi:sugar phosphate isomerase/epimerase [Mesorhizobium sp. BR1-1-16]|uniref:sugar phosphate isomerase/epimerase family protein n=1 Tax=Mesorhizobium sp. BR1-1-16 TaxID=2876653 RepID=UPI001CCD79DC|nr:sugar phosphate isomerase/epimerase [Mesorhizobium sp. BR1-1-16]MBZ9938741.1 sugar phosphate isomerase/epimerase [Mesorhizobium sp. BR1-1-16]
MQKLIVMQSLWAMERRQTDGLERSLEKSVEMIIEARYDGVSTDWRDRARSKRIAAMLKSHGMVAEGQCFPQTVDDLKPVLEIASETGLHHLDIQPDVRPRTIAECVPLIEGWMRLAEQVDFPVYIETHRDRMTTDLYFVLDLLDRFPDLKLLADLSHFLVGREFADPVSDENHAYIHRVLDSSFALHGRVASREQVQIEISFPHHRKWLDLFLGWWDYGMRSWRRRSADDAELSFVCELGPQPYAIAGPDGNDLSDRWSDALMMREEVTALWSRIIREAG